MKKKPKTIADLKFNSLIFGQQDHFEYDIRVNNSEYANYKVIPSIYKIYVNNEYCCCDIPITLYIYDCENSLYFFMDRLNSIIRAMYGSGRFRLIDILRLNDLTYLLNIKGVENEK